MMSHLISNTTGDGMADEGSLRGSSDVVAERIKEDIQKRVTDAGIEVIELVSHT